MYLFVNEGLLETALFDGFGIALSECGVNSSCTGWSSNVSYVTLGNGGGGIDSAGWIAYLEGGKGSLDFNRLNSATE